MKITIIYQFMICILRITYVNKHNKNEFPEIYILKDRNSINYKMAYNGTT